MSSDKQSITVEIAGNDIIEFDIDNQDVLLKYANAPSSSLHNLQKQTMNVHCLSSATIKCNQVQCKVVVDKTVKCTDCTVVDCVKCNITHCEQIKCADVLCMLRECHRVDCVRCSNCYYYYE